MTVKPFGADVPFGSPMSENLKLVPLETWPVKVNEDVVKQIERLLERAKAGEFDGFAYAASCKDGSVSHGFSDSVDFAKLLGGVTILSYRMCVARPKE